MQSSDRIITQVALLETTERREKLSARSWNLRIQFPPFQSYASLEFNIPSLSSISRIENISYKRASHPSDRSRFFSSAFKDSSQMFVVHSHTGCTATYLVSGKNRWSELLHGHSSNSQTKSSLESVECVKIKTSDSKNEWIDSLR